MTAPTPTSSTTSARVHSALHVMDRDDLVTWWRGVLGGDVDWDDAQRDLAQVSWDGYPMLVAGPLGDPTPQLHPGSRALPPGTSVLLLTNGPDALDALQRAFTQRGVQGVERQSQPWGELRLTLPLPVSPVDPGSAVRPANAAATGTPYELAFLAQLPRDPAAWLADFRAGADALEHAVIDLSAPELDLRPHPYAWSIRQHVHHLADMEVTGLVSNRFALAEPGREVVGNGYDQDVWAAALHYADRDVAPSLALFRATRSWTLQLLDLLPDAWERSSHAPHGAPFAVGTMLEMLTAHALGHIAEIHAIRAQHGIPAPNETPADATPMVVTGTSS